MTRLKFWVMLCYRLRYCSGRILCDLIPLVQLSSPLTWLLLTVIVLSSLICSWMQTAKHSQILLWSSNGGKPRFTWLNSRRVDGSLILKYQCVISAEVAEGKQWVAWSLHTSWAKVCKVVESIQWLKAEWRVVTDS